jgi:outer membrane protein assembly factor BamA
MSAKSDTETTGTLGTTTERTSESVDAKKYYNSTDFGLNFGFGYNFTENIGAGVRYTSGLSNIAKDVPSYKVNNTNIALSVAYTF